MSQARIPELSFFFWEISTALKNRRRLKSFITSILNRKRKAARSISFIFTSDINLHKINKQFLNHDYYTDILTFELSEEQAPLVAEIYISVDRVRENASIQGTTVQEELHRVIFHGVLHLCGYKDKSRHQKMQMRRKEDHYLAEYFNNVSRDTLF